MMLLPLCLCLVIAFLLSGIESALLTVSRVRARHAAEEGDRLAARLVRLLEHRNQLLHSVTALNRLASLVAFALCAVTLVRWLGTWGWAAALLLALPVFLIGLEFVPKLLFRRYPFRLLRRLSTLLSVIYAMAKPWIWLARRINPEAVNGSTPDGDNHGLQSLAQTVTQLGVLPGSICALVQRLVEFQKLRAAGIMLPLTSLTALPPDMPLTSVMTLNLSPKHPWLAVLGAEGALLGWLDMAALPSKPLSDKLVRQFMRPLLQVRLTDTGLRCLQALRKRGEPVASVVDANGEAVGVITQQALVQVLVS